MRYVSISGKPKRKRGPNDHVSIRNFSEMGGPWLKFQMDYHHMDTHGYYDGWTNHTVTVKTSLVWDFNIVISGKNRNAIKDYLSEVIHSWLNSETDI